MPAKSANGSEKFLRLLERNVKQVLLAKDASRDEKLQAIAAGAKLLAVRVKLDTDDKGFFS